MAGITFSATYIRNGASVNVGAPGVTITVQPLATPVITSSLPGGTTGQLPVICSPTTITATVAGANRYDWTSTTGGLGLNSAGATSYISTTGSITVYPGSGNGQGTITVKASNTASNSCASPVSAGYGLFFGCPPRTTVPCA